jgi:hypothetical protein
MQKSIPGTGTVIVKSVLINLFDILPNYTYGTGSYQAKYPARYPVPVAGLYLISGFWINQNSGRQKQYPVHPLLTCTSPSFAPGDVLSRIQEFFIPDPCRIRDPVSGKKYRIPICVRITGMHAGS